MDGKIALEEHWAVDETLNIAGPRASQELEIAEFVADVLAKAMVQSGS